MWQRGTCDPSTVARALRSIVECNGSATINSQRDSQMQKKQPPIKRNGPNSRAAEADSARKERLEELAETQGDELADKLPDDVDALKGTLIEARRQVAALTLANEQLTSDVNEGRALRNRAERLQAVTEHQKRETVSRWRPVLGSQTGDRCKAILPRMMVNGTQSVTCKFDVYPYCLGEWQEDEETGEREFVISDPGPTLYESEGQIRGAGDFYAVTK